VIDSVRCEVLNASYDPLSIVSARRALNLCLKGKASVVEEHPELAISSGNDIWPIPTQIRLNYMVKSRPRGNAQLTQRNLFVRDKSTCQYCGRHRSKFKQGEFLTRDHVHPQSKGGQDTWKNVVAACITCNNKKADYLLSEIDMKLLKEPFVPTVFEIISKARIERMKKKSNG
jgi:5-methylcytosine-specific restriction endonuclease McrA